MLAGQSSDRGRGGGKREARVGPGEECNRAPGRAFLRRSAFGLSKDERVHEFSARV